MARRSTAVEPEGTHTIIMGLAMSADYGTLRMKCLIISSATSKSAMTPSRSGGSPSILPGVTPQHHLGVVADGTNSFLAHGCDVATHEGLFKHNAAGLYMTSVFAVPRSSGHVARKRAEKTPNILILVLTWKANFQNFKRRSRLKSAPGRCPGAE